MLTDLAVGAHNSGQVVVLFSRPPITVRTHLNSSQAHFDSNTSAITLQACVRFQGKYLPKHLDFRLTLDFIDARFQFKENTQSCSRNLTIEKKKVKCEEFIIYAKVSGVRYIYLQ